MGGLPRYDLGPLFRVNFVDSNGESRFTFLRILIQVVAPLAAGVGMGLWVHSGLHIQNGVSVALPSASLLVGAMFGAFVFLTNLRVKVAEAATFAFRADLHRLVGSAAATCLYIAIVSVVLAGILGLVGSLPVLRSVAAVPFTVGLLVFLAAHIGITLLTAVRRIFLVYLEMFASDFDPEVQDPPKTASSTVDNSVSPRMLESTRLSKRLERRKQ